MNILISDEEFKSRKSRDLIPLKCECCSITFFLKKNEVQRCKKYPTRRRGILCSRKCRNTLMTTKSQFNCKECDKEVTRSPSERKKAKNVFCSNVCSGIYGAKNKTTGGTRSKLERWTELRLTERYGSLPIIFNDTTVIGAELDIYFPTLSLAFELNGIFHYEDIFGKLDATQNRDKMKVSLCANAGIGLCVIDTSKMKYFKESACYEFWQIIINIIDERIRVASSQHNNEEN